MIRELCAHVRASKQLQTDAATPTLTSFVHECQSVIILAWPLEVCSHFYLTLATVQHEQLAHCYSWTLRSAVDRYRVSRSGPEAPQTRPVWRVPCPGIDARLLKVIGARSGRKARNEGAVKNYWNRKPCTMLMLPRFRSTIMSG